MKEINTRLTEPTIHHTITHNLRTEFTEEIRDVITLNSPLPINVTYNNTVALTIDSTETDLPKDSSYISTDKEIFTLSNSKDFQNISCSITSLERIIAYSPKTKDLTELVEILKWSSKYNTPRETEGVLVALCSYKDREILIQDPYLKDKFKLKIPNEGYMIYQIPLNSREIAVKDYNYKKESSINYSITEQLLFRFSCGLDNALIAYANKNFSLGRTMLDRFLRSANIYMENINKNNTSSTKASNYYDIVRRYVTIINTVVAPQYQKPCIMKCYKHIISHHEPSILSIKMLIRNKEYDDALELFHDFKTKHGNEPKASIISKDLQTEIYVQLGNYVLNTKNDPFLALSFLKGAYENYDDRGGYTKHNNSHALVNSLYSLARIYDKNYCNKLILSLPSPLKSLLLLHSGKNFINIRMSDIHGLSEKQIPKEFHDILALARFIAAQRKIIESGASGGENNFYKKLTDLTKQKVDIRSLIDVSLAFARFDVAQKLLSSISMGEIWADERLFTQFIFYNAHAISDCFATIEKAPIDTQLKSSKHFEAATTSILENNNELAQKHLERAMELAPHNESYVEAAMLNSILMHNTESAEKYKSDLSVIDENYKMNRSSFEDDDLLSTTVDDEIYIEEAYPSQEEIHQKFQLIKEQRLNAISKFQQEDKWYLTKDITVNIGDSTFLGEHRGLKYWGAVSNEFDTKWSEHQNTFKAALQKGFVHRNQGQNGVKALSGKVFEIKINGSLRAFTNKAHYNQNKNMLLYFEYVDNHKAIKKFTNINKLIFVDANNKK